MSSQTVESIAQLARERITELGEDVAGFTIPRLQALVPDALNNLCIKIAYREDYKNVRKEIAVSVINGIITVSDATILMDTVPLTGTLFLGGVYSRPHESYETLLSRLPTDTNHHALRNQKIHVKAVTTGALGTAGGSGGLAGTLDASFLATLSELPSRYDRELVDEVVALALNKVGGATPKTEERSPEIVLKQEGS